MFVLLLHGPPAAGKYTIGRRLAEQLGLPLFHNHLAVDVAKSLFDFGTPGFVELREAIWLATFRAAAAASKSFIFTFNPEASVAPDLIGRLEAIVLAAGGKVHYVALQCSESVVEARLANESRAAFGKLRDVQLYRSIRRAGGFAFPPLPKPLLVVDTETSSAEASVAAIQAALESLPTDARRGERKSNFTMADDLETLLDEFEIDGGFHERWGPAKARGEVPVQLKLCVTATRIEPLARMMYALSLREDCWFVKLDRELGSHGMARGRCFLTAREAVLQLWKEHKVTADVLCSVQDDDVTHAYR